MTQRSVVGGTRGGISLGDYVRAVAELSPDREAAIRIGELLGLSAGAVRPPVPVHGAWGPAPAARPHVAASRAAPVPEPSKAIGPREPAPPGPVDTDRPWRVVVESHRSRSGPPTPPGWVRETPPLPPRSTEGTPLPPPLIHPHVRRGIVSAALATRTPEGAVDVDLAVAVLSEGRPLREVPRRPVPSLRFGVQVLVDVRRSMAPYAADQSGLVDALRDLVPSHRFAVRSFAGTPLHGTGTGPRRTWTRWEPPARPTPILLLTDLGIGGALLDPDRAGTTAWLEFADRAAGAGCPVVAFVPHEPARWPRRLTHAMVLVHWSERLTAGALRRAIGPGHRVR